MAGGRVVYGLTIKLMLLAKDMIEHKMCVYAVDRRHIRIRILIRARIRKRTALIANDTAHDKICIRPAHGRVTTSQPPIIAHIS